MSCTALVVRSGVAEIRFLLDPAKGYAVRRRIEKTPSGELAVRADCSDFTQVPGSGLWMPRKVEVEWHMWPYYLPKPVKEAVIRETYRVSELKSEPISPEHFVLKFHDAGTAVSDGTIEGKKNSRGRIDYYVPADPGRLDQVIKAAASGKDYLPTIVSFRKKLILANVLLILIVIGVAWSAPVAIPADGRIAGRAWFVCIPGPLTTGHPHDDDDTRIALRSPAQPCCHGGAFDGAVDR